MVKLTWEQRLIIALICISVIVYIVKLLVFGDDGESNTLSYIFNSLGFLPINILIVTIIINRLLSMRAKQQQQEKMKMVIGLFFSEMGVRLLRLITASDSNAEEIRNILAVHKAWTPGDFSQAKQQLASCRFTASPSAADLIEIRGLLEKHHEFLLRLIENPVLLEHNSISKLLQDLFHLGEELASRGNIADLPKTDIAHLAGDVNRVYPQLTFVWLDHMEYLAANYPYLLSLSIRKSPFTPQCDVVVRE
ncbi:hypothetical protein McpSp1_12830 [Methanocorpusculaceae archaeon Sp1]|uniref:Uncharacterized protein n=1 Tax=Methanorbis furvi TaxID=3028299 RepID=A0AAE4MAH7_9EURY|nr:hypothetical protein [Methanocorpusculaceae archaeon Sp1]MDV0441250.1 hypothetical protein [Methanocorpusculaceae archaeon Ag1]